MVRAETISLRNEWMEFGGEATLYRNGRRMLILDRRFLVPDERVVTEDRV
ncbi:MAG: hypothetical protein ACO1SV_06100 [Fimbriimonas sp.]